jgi:hypothetical protein
LYADCIFIFIPECFIADELLLVISLFSASLKTEGSLKARWGPSSEFFGVAYYQPTNHNGRMKREGV